MTMFLPIYTVSFRSAGEIWAASLAQSGPPPCCLKLWCYKYLCDAELQIQHISKEDVSDAQYTSLISQVRGLKGFYCCKMFGNHICVTQNSQLS